MNQREFSDFPTLKTECLKMLEESVRSPYLLSFLVDLLEDEATNGSAESLQKAKEVRHNKCQNNSSTPPRDA